MPRWKLQKLTDFVPSWLTCCDKDFYFTATDSFSRGASVSLGALSRLCPGSKEVLRLCPPPTQSGSPGRAQSSSSALPSAPKAALFSSEDFSLPQGKCSAAMWGEQLLCSAAGAEEWCVGSFWPDMFWSCTFLGTIWNAYDLISQIMQFYLAFGSGFGILWIVYLDWLQLGFPWHRSI